MCKYAQKPQHRIILCLWTWLYYLSWRTPNFWARAGFDYAHAGPPALIVSYIMLYRQIKTTYALSLASHLKNRFKQMVAKVTRGFECFQYYDLIARGASLGKKIFSSRYRIQECGNTVSCLGKQRSNRVSPKRLQYNKNKFTVLSITCLMIVSILKIPNMNKKLTAML